MPVFRSPDALLSHQRARFKRVTHQAKALHRDLADDMLDEAIELTSGKVKTRTLRRLGHPFGRRLSGRMRGLTQSQRRGGARINLLPINEQSGKLRAGWRLRHSQSTTVQSYELRNKAPYARYILSLGGTKKMVARGFWAELKKRWRKANFRLLLALRKS